MFMPITCPACAASFELADTLRGRKAFCPRCGQGLVITGAGTAKRDEGGRAAPVAPVPAPARSWKLPLIVLGAVLLVAVNVLLIVSVLSRGKDDDQNKLAQANGAPAGPALHKFVPAPRPAVATPDNGKSKQLKLPEKGASELPKLPEKKEPPPPDLAVTQGPPSIRLKAKMKLPEAPPKGVDKFGNPEGDVGLRLGKEVKGNRLLVWSGEPEAQQQVMLINGNPATSPLWSALQNRGLVLTFKADPFNPEWLKQADQLWIISGMQNRLDETSLKAIEDFARAGKGLYLLADNEPYLWEANELAKRLFDTTVQGNYGGTQVAYVARKGLTPEAIQQFKGQYAADDHPLLAGVNFIYEGITISNVKPTPKLETVLKASDGQILAAVAVDPKMRVVVDCGWTRYEMQFLPNSAGSARFGENVAVYLCGE